MFEIYLDIYILENKLCFKLKNKKKEVLSVYVCLQIENNNKKQEF